MATYSWQNVQKISFTDADIELATSELSPSDVVKTVATLTSQQVPPFALKAFGELAISLTGQVTMEFGNLAIVVPKTASELRDSASYNLHYSSRYEDLRDERALESGVEPESV